MRNVMIAFICGAALFLVGCQEVKQEYSETLHEDAVIEDVAYTPSKHESRIEPTFHNSGAIGFGPSGVGVRMSKSMQITSVTVPEKFVVVFRYQHGQFIISRKEVYDKFKDHKGKTVDLAYRGVYRTIYDTKDGEKQAVKRELMNHDFLYATLK